MANIENYEQKLERIEKVVQLAQTHSCVLVGDEKNEYSAENNGDDFPCWAALSRRHLCPKFGEDGKVHQDITVRMEMKGRCQFMETSIFWLLGMIAAAAFTVYANSQYQSAKSKEAKTEIAENVSKVLLPEIKANRELIPTFSGALSKNEIPIQKFSTTAWETVSSGGLLVNLDPNKIEQLTWTYYLIEHCNESFGALSF